MICERAEKIDMRDLPRALPPTLTICGIPIHITWTICHLGGQRPWFICPTCGRRCRIIYPTRCRLCIRGRYAQELRTVEDRKLHKAFKLRERLGQTRGGIIGPFPPKPKWMRWHTYIRRRQECLAIEREIWAADYAKCF